MNRLILENENMRLEFDRSNGALVRLVAVGTGWNIIGQPHLGLSFRLLIPLPERRNNPVFGEKQLVNSITVSSDKQCVTFKWDSIISEHGGRHNINVTLEVRLSRHQAVFNMEINNNSKYVVENVYCPYLGNVSQPEDEKWFKTFIYKYADASEWSL